MDRRNPGTQLLVALALAVLATGCGGGSTVKSSRDAGPTAGTNAQPEATVPTETPTQDNGRVSSTTLPFGTAFTWEDHLVVKVGPPRPFKASPYAAGGEHSKAKVAFAVTLINGTRANFDPVLFSTTLQSGNTQGDEIFDSSTLADAPTTVLLPGREAHWTIAYGVDVPRDLVLQVTPDFEHQAAVFTNVHSPS